MKITKRKISVYILLAVFWIAVGIGSAEIALRIMSGGMFVDRTTIELNPYYEYQNIPGIRTPRMIEGDGVNILQTNAAGFAGKDYSYDKPAGTFRIMVIGDSFVEGKSIQAEKMFTALLEEKLNNEFNGSLKFEVIPRGTSSWSTENEVLYLKKEGLKYKPDIVIISFFANDIKDNFDKKLYTLDSDGDLVDNTPFKFTLWQSAQVWCRSVSELCGFARFKIYPLIFGDTRANSLYWGIAEDLVTKNTSEETLRAVDETRDIFHEFKLTSVEVGFKPIILFIPFKEQVDSESMEKMIARNNIDRGNMDVMKTNDMVKRLAGDTELSVFDPTELFVEKNIDEKLYYTVDSHLNAHGNDVLADFLIDRLKDWI